MLVKTVKVTEYIDSETRELRTRPVGAKIEHRDAYMLCLLGTAEPLDEECFVELENRNWKSLLRFSKRRKRLADSEQPKEDV